MVALFKKKLLKQTYDTLNEIKERNKINLLDTKEKN